MTRAIILVGLGGGLGSILRYLSSVWVNKLFSGTFPLATFLINMLGSLLIGVLLGWITKFQPENADLKFLLVTGFCGGYTTFSAFSAENIHLLQSGQITTAIAYMAGSVLIGIVAVGIGLSLVKLM